MSDEAAEGSSIAWPSIALRIAMVNVGAYLLNTEADAWSALCLLGAAVAFYIEQKKPTKVLSTLDCIYIGFSAALLAVAVSGRLSR